VKRSWAFSSSWWLDAPLDFSLYPYTFPLLAIVGTKLKGIIIGTVVVEVYPQIFGQAEFTSSHSHADTLVSNLKEKTQKNESMDPIRHRGSESC